MSVNLANTYAALLRKYGDNYTIAYGAPPSYLTSIVGASEVGTKIVFFYKEDRSGTNNKAVSNLATPKKLYVKSERSPNNSDLDLTGSPLKDDCIVDDLADLSLDLQLATHNPWKPEEEYQRGISVDKARAIICTEEFQLGDGQGSVWFLCDGSDYGRTQLLQFEFNKTHFARGIVSYTGVFPAYMVTSQALVRHHKLAVGSATFETYIENCYQMNPNMTLRCTWSTPAALPSLVDLSVCDVALSQTFRVSECGPLTQEFMNQLRILVYIREDIVNYHKNEQADVNREPTYRCGAGIDMDELRDTISKTMTEVSGFGDANFNGHAEFDIEGVVQRAKLRCVTDLTDKLWELLKRCSSYKDLKVAFNMLFQCAARCNIVNTPTNKNRLAEIITELANRRLAIPCLNGAEPLELLLEIGMEKLYKDYEFIYTESKVCSANLLKNCGEALNDAANGVGITQNGDAGGLPKLRKSLHNAVRGDTTPASSMRKTLLHHNVRQAGTKYLADDLAGFRNSNFDEYESLTKISKLFQIHCTLEHLLMLHTNINLSNVYGDVCAQLLKKPPRLVESIDDQLCDAMDIHLSAKNIREHLDGKDPHSRHITMKSQNKYRELYTTLYFNLENICPPELGQCFQCDDKELIKERTYHSWLYRKVCTLK